MDNWVIKSEIITNTIIEIENTHLNEIISYQKIISYLTNLLIRYRENVMEFGFKDENQEINFFKNFKILPHSFLIQYSKQMVFSTKFSALTNDYGVNCINDNIKIENDFISRHYNFYIYLVTDSSHKDQSYFLRNKETIENYNSSHYPNLDTEFSTSYSDLFAQIRASLNFQKFLKFKLNGILSHNEVQEIQSKYKWTDSKVALTELVLALKNSGSINHGNVTFIELIKTFQEIFGIELGDINHTAMRMKDRTQPTRYINKLKTSLENWIVQTDN